MTTEQQLASRLGFKIEFRNDKRVCAYVVPLPEGDYRHPNANDAYKLWSLCLELMERERWIPCSEPPANQDCILVWDGKTVIFGRYEDFMFEKAFCYAGGGRIFKPIKWRPLPSAPGSEEQ